MLHRNRFLYYFKSIKRYTCSENTPNLLAFRIVIWYNNIVKILLFGANSERSLSYSWEMLADSLDSGSSVHCGRAGSSPASPTKKAHPFGCAFYFAHFERQY